MRINHYSAFTLVELMISVSIAVLLLLLGLQALKEVSVVSLKTKSDQEIFDQARKTIEYVSRELKQMTVAPYFDLYDKTQGRFSNQGMNDDSDWGLKLKTDSSFRIGKETSPQSNQFTYSSEDFLYYQKIGRSIELSSKSYTLWGVGFYLNEDRLYHFKVESKFLYANPSTQWAKNRLNGAENDDRLVGENVFIFRVTPLQKKSESQNRVQWSSLSEVASGEGFDMFTEINQKLKSNETGVRFPEAVQIILAVMDIDSMKRWKLLNENKNAPIKIPNEWFRTSELLEEDLKKLHNFLRTHTKGIFRYKVLSQRIIFEDGRDN